MQNIWQKYAEVLVDYSTEVKKGDKVIIRGESQAQPLIKAVYEEVLKRGAFPTCKVSIPGISESFFKHANDEQLEYVCPYIKHEYETADKFISIGAPYNTKNMAKVPAEKQAKVSSARQPLSKLLLGRAAKKELSWVICDFPTEALAQEGKMSLDDYSEFLFNACYLYEEDPVAEWKKIGEMQDKIVEYLNGTSKIRYVGEKTDITFSTEGRKWVSCCGLNNFPDGEVFTSPVEDSAEGQIYFDFPQCYRGNEAKGVLVKLEKGKVVHAECESGEDFFIKMIDQDEGARFVGEIAIGTNKMIQEVTGNILFDEKIGGSIHVALGSSYPETGGKNESGLHWDLIKNMKNGGQIYADDKLIYENGEFLI